jgi:monoamine oxidase
MTFDEFLSGTPQPQDVRDWARSFVQGFNAARADVISIKALAQESDAADAIDGDRSFRILNGYDSVPLALCRQAQDIRLNTVVESIGWSKGSVSAHVRSAFTGELTALRAKRAIVTVPLGVLQTGTIRFDPEPVDNLAAARQLCFGQVVRLVLRFRERIWDSKKEFADAGFLLSDAPVFPTWWSTLPVRAPVIVGWSAGPKADALAACDRDEVLEKALDQLAKITHVPAHELQESLDQVYYHDWATDPFARGAYSYVPAGSADARQRLARPAEDTLFFAGEAANTEGHAATVHGAIASGRTAAQHILFTSRQRL